MKFPNTPKKSLGQNFLTDQNIVAKIISIGNISKGDTILEIGPGYGSLTKEIIKYKPKKIFAVEKDKRVTQYIKKDLINYKNIEIINEDILKIISKNNFGNNIIIFGNLPYNISSQVLASLILLDKWPPWYKKVILMFQEELANRIVAKYKTKEYGRLSILANWRLEIKKHFNVSRNCFYPSPKINSTVLSFEPKKYKYKLKNPKTLESVTRTLFSNRRKMINKSLTRIFKNNKNIAKELNINLSKRPEELDNETFYKIASKYEKLFN